MKKIALLSCLFLAACVDHKHPTNYGPTTIDGHTYKIFVAQGNYGQTYVHDPECLLRDMGITRLKTVDNFTVH